MPRRILLGVGASALAVPLLGLADPSSATPWTTALPAFAAALAAAGGAAILRRSRPPVRIAGGLIVSGSVWLFSQVPAGEINWVLAGLLGLGVGLSWTGGVRDRVVLSSTALMAAALFAVAAAWDANTARTVGIATGAALIGAAVLARRRWPAALRDGSPVPAAPSDGWPVPPAPSAGWLVPTAGVVGVVLVGAWIGANSPTATWFGATVSHGPRDRPEVAITFDDGPNATTTLGIASILDAHGAKGTFFSVGKAVDARPDLTGSLVADGQLVGDHSYSHDGWRWLDPRYPELARAQRAIHTATGVCPAFYRPPHGQHTPFLAAVVHHSGATMVGWDVSAGDWATRDPQLIAHRVLSKVRAGSIIDLHDGLDGKVNVDRTVLLRALPLILDGLAAKHLQPVRLDQLLGRPGYTDRC